jgi:hypothetical protein
VSFSQPICNPRSFREEARFQRVCQLCGAPGPFHAHHVVDKKELEKKGLRGNDLYDTRNAMRLCEGLDTKRCHFQFENRMVPITTEMLMDQHIEYAFEKLGAYAFDYLRQEYDDSAEDPRIAAALATTLVA